MEPPWLLLYSNTIHSVALTSLMKCDSSNAVTLSMQTVGQGQSERETLLERALGTTKGGGPTRR